MIFPVRMTWSASFGPHWPCSPSRPPCSPTRLLSTAAPAVFSVIALMSGRTPTRTERACFPGSSTTRWASNDMSTICWTYPCTSSTARADTWTRRASRSGTSWRVVCPHCLANCPASVTGKTTSRRHSRRSGSRNFSRCAARMGGRGANCALCRHCGPACSTMPPASRPPGISPVAGAWKNVCNCGPIHPGWR